MKCVLCHKELKSWVHNASPFNGLCCNDCYIKYVLPVRFDINSLLGKTIKIINMKGEPNYSGKIGIVTYIDDQEQLFGSWDGLAVNIKTDDFIILANKNKVE